jgi:hypothetical protein
MRMEGLQIRRKGKLVSSARISTWNQLIKRGKKAARIAERGRGAPADAKGGFPASYLAKSTLCATSRACLKAAEYTKSVCRATNSRNALSLPLSAYSRSNCASVSCIYLLNNRPFQNPTSFSAKTFGSIVSIFCRIVLFLLQSPPMSIQMSELHRHLMIIIRPMWIQVMAALVS